MHSLSLIPITSQHREGAQSIYIELDRLASPEQMPKPRSLPPGDQQDLIRIPETKIHSGADGKILNMVHAPAHLK